MKTNVIHLGLSDFELASFSNIHVNVYIIQAEYITCLPACLVQTQQTQEQMDAAVAVQQLTASDDQSLADEMDTLEGAEERVKLLHAQNEDSVLHNHGSMDDDDDKDGGLGGLSHTERQRLCVSQFQGIVSVVTEAEGRYSAWLH